MFKVGVILLLISILVTLSAAEPGLFGGGGLGKKGIMPIVKQPVIVEHKYVIEEQPCKSDKCRPKPPPPEEWPCQSDKCRSCRNECNGNEKCHNDCISVDKCRNNCYGNDKCVMECGKPIIIEPDRCRGCNQNCPGNQPPLIWRCEPGKSLYYVQIPKNIFLSDFVSNPDLLRLYMDSNLEIDANGISGRVCLNDKTRLDLIRLNAILMSVDRK